MAQQPIQIERASLDQVRALIHRPWWHAIRGDYYLTAAPVAVPAARTECGLARQFAMVLSHG